MENLAVAELVSAALLGATVGALCGQAGRPTFDFEKKTINNMLG